MDVSQLLESINQNINEGIYRSNEKGLIYVNKAFAKMFGYSSEDEVLSENSIDLYKDPADRLRLIELLNSFGSFENEEVTLVRRNGQEFIGLLSSMIYTDEAGNRFWDGAIRDVTEHREALRQARENNQLLQTINQNINEAIYRSIRKKGLIYVNEEFVRMFGYKSADEIYTSDALNLYKDPKERDVLGDELIEEGSISNREVEFQRKDGSTFWGYMSSIKSVGDNGTIYFDGAIRDITHQKESEEALKYYAEMQNMLINLSSNYINLPLDKLDASILSSLEELGRFVSADRAYIFEYNFKDQVYSNTFEWCREGINSVMDESQDLNMNAFPALINDHFEGKTIFIEDVSKMAEKSSREMLMSQDIKSLITVPMMSENSCIGFVGFDSVHDFRSYSEDEVVLLKVTAEIFVNLINRSKNQKRLEQILNTANNQNKRLKEFSYITSHNFRSSVANLLSLTQALETEPENSEYLKMLKTTTYKLSEAISTINEMLNFENEVAELKEEECSLVETIDRVKELNNQLIRQERIELRVDISSKLKVVGYPPYFESIFHNIITNAIKYGTTPDSNVIELVASKKKKEIEVLIKDYGLGIDMRRFGNKLFKLGARFHPGKGEGQGMGLFMTKHQVEAMGGRIEVESELNSGTTFKLYFNG